MTSLLPFLWVSLGGFIGGVTRYVLFGVLGPRWGILIANSVGCFLIGAAHLTNAFDLTIAIGGAAALSTWPALAAECGHLIKTKNYMGFVLYLGLCLAVGHLAAFTGHQIPSFW